MQRIRDFQIVRELGRGEFGIPYEAYEAIDPVLEQRVVLEVLNPKLMAQSKVAASIVEDVHNLARMSHPSVRKLYEFFQLEDSYCLVLEHAEGTPLQTIIDNERLTLGKAISILIDIADGLAYLHEHDLIHCNIQPENILLRKDNPAMITDFGLAKFFEANNATTDRLPTRNANYVSPEQAKHHFSPAVDVYALGVLAYQMITGQLPFAVETTIQGLLIRLNESSPQLTNLLPDIPRSLSDLIAKTLEIDPAQRPQAREVVERLKMIQEEIQDAKLDDKIFYISSVESMRHGVEVKATYTMGSKVAQPLIDEFIYIDE